MNAGIPSPSLWAYIQQELGLLDERLQRILKNEFP